jgi:hypothetical protein
MHHLITILLVAITLVSAAPKNIVGYTYTLKSNDSLIILDGTTQQLIKSQYIGNVAYRISATALDVKKRIFYAYVTS